MQFPFNRVLFCTDSYQILSSDQNMCPCVPYLRATRAPETICRKNFKQDYLSKQADFQPRVPFKES